MNAVQPTFAGQIGLAGARLDADAVSRAKTRCRRGRLVRRALVTADVSALALAFALAQITVAGSSTADLRLELAALGVTIVLWILGARVFGLYERDEEQVDHSTIDELVSVVLLVTFGLWCFVMATWVAGLTDMHLPRLIVFWSLASILVVLARGLARMIARRSPLYVQNTIIVGAGHIGQLAARKLLQHPEYKINLIGFVDSRPRPRRAEIERVPVLENREELAELIRSLDVDRVIIAFSESRHEEMLETVRRLRTLDVQIDVVPRLFEIVGPRAGIHAFEGLPLVGLRPVGLSRSARAAKRIADIVVATVMLLALLPVLGLIAMAIRLDSEGPCLFRQRRLGLDMRPFTVLKFRTMRLDTDQEEHRRYIASTLTHEATPNGNGLYKLERDHAITRVGRILRKTSLDELPQLFNVIAGDMSLVGPRPCLDYETDGFSEHHFERFLMPPGLTGLWQVTARARSTFGEALEMDVAYVRGWSLGLDLRLLLKTPFSLIRMRATT